MKHKLYTYSYDEENLKGIIIDKLFTSKEHSLAEKKQWGLNYKTKEDLFRAYLPAAYKSLANCQNLVDLIINNNLQNIISFGAGAPVREYLLKLILPIKFNVVATDFDTFIIKKVEKYFPEITVKEYDFANQDLKIFLNQNNLKIDLAIFFGSSYVMDDHDFIRVFKDLRNNGARYIIDYNAGYISFKEQLKLYFIPNFIRNKSILRKLTGRKNLSNRSKGKFHGYARSRDSLRKLYTKSGWNIKDYTKDQDNNYIAILNAINTN